MTNHQPPILCQLDLTKPENVKLAKKLYRSAAYIFLSDPKHYRCAVGASHDPAHAAHCAGVN